MKTQRFLSEGENLVNGYTVVVSSIESAKQVSETSRIAAKYYGTITDADGNIISDFTQNGKTAKQIKVLCGLEEASTTKTDSRLRLLEKTRANLISFGCDTTEIDKAIKVEKEAIEVAKAAKEAAKKEAAKRKLLNSKELKELRKTQELLTKLGMSTVEVDNKIDNLLKSIE